MDDHYLNASWASLFLVTALCSFLFSGILRLLDGHAPRLLLIIGAVASIFALISWLIKLQKKSKNEN